MTIDMSVMEGVFGARPTMKNAAKPHLKAARPFEMPIAVWQGRRPDGDRTELRRPHLWKWVYTVNVHTSEKRPPS
jgi:hypothetical protein